MGPVMQVIQWSGKPVSRPGIYREIPMRNDAGTGYHQNVAVRPSISSSGIRTIFSQSPAHYFAGSYLNPNAEPDKESEPLLFGRAAHHLLLGEADFQSHFVIRPETYLDAEARSKPWNANSGTCKAWLAEARASGRSVLTLAQLARIRGMAEALKVEPLIRAGILNGCIEHSIIWRDEESGVWLKVRPDAIPAVDMSFADLKTIEDITDDGIERAISDRDLHVQGALVGMAARAVWGREMESFSLVFVEKSAPFCVRVRELTPADLALGEQQIRAVLPIFAKAVESGVWHGPGGGQVDAQFAEVTPWRRKAIERRLQVLASEGSI
jgi:hypothetical protein